MRLTIWQTTDCYRSNKSKGILGWNRLGRCKRSKACNRQQIVFSLIPNFCKIGEAFTEDVLLFAERISVHYRSYVT